MPITQKAKQADYANSQALDQRSSIDPRTTDTDAERAQTEGLQRLEQRRRTVISKQDRRFDDFVEGKLTDDFWRRKSNCTFDRGTVCPTCTSPFDLLVRGMKREIGELSGTSFATG